MVNVLDYGFKVVDSDLGEIFFNVILDLTMQLSSGVDLTIYETDLKKRHPKLRIQHEKLIAVWNKSWMNYTPSPFGAVRSYHLVEEFIVRNFSNLTNFFSYDKFILNLPGNEEYNPALRRLHKWDIIDNMSTADMKQYM